MAKTKQKISITEAEDRQIRRVWDEDRVRWYFSITDIIGVLTESTDARNYWKTLKNRLKNTQNQLVSECNQLKLPSSDGKSYLADVADRDTLLKIIKVIDPTSIPAFRSWLDHIEVKNSLKNNNTVPQNNNSVTSGSEILNLENLDENELSTTLEAPFDMYENSNEIFIKFMVPGCEVDKLILGVSMQTLTIKGERLSPINFQFKENDERKYLIEELQWGKFYRKVELPTLVDVDQILATEFQGLITIKLIKIDQNKNRFIKIKAL